MTELRELTNSGRRLVERTLQDGGLVTDLDDTDLRQHTVRIEGATADLDGLREELDVIRDNLREYDHHIDAAAAEPIREYLDLSRREAANERLWHWLAVAEFPEFVYHRWPDRDSLDNEEKFLAAGTDIYSNALHRLWWGAELTRDGEDYDRTCHMFEQGELANDVLDRWFARFQPAAKVIVDQLRCHDSTTISDTTRDLRNDLSRYTLELMTSEDISSLVDRELPEE